MDARRGLRMAAAVLAAALVASAAAALLPEGSGAQSGGVLVVGDSLEVGTGPYLRRELGSTPVAIDADTGRPSTVGLRVLSSKLRPSHRVVVFDLGTNDDPSQPGGLAGRLEAVRRVVGDKRCLVVSTLSRPPLNGVSIDGMNRVITNFVAATPGAQLFDWHDATESDPGLLGPDRVHPGGSGYATRARLLAGVIGSCLDAGKTADKGDEDIPKPRDADAEPPPAPRARPAAASDTPLLDLLTRLPYLSLYAIGQSALDRVEAAAREFVGAVSPQPKEPTLGSTPGARSGPPAGGTAKPQPRVRRPHGTGD